MASNRMGRINEEIQRELAALIPTVKDPRVTGMISVTAVEASPDLKQAKVKVSVYDKEQAPREESVNALNGAEGFIAREVGRRMQLRALPKFKFLLDDSIAYSVHISQVIDSLGIKKDSEGKDEE